MSQQCALAAKQVNCTKEGINRSVAVILRKIAVFCFSAFIRLRPKFCTQPWTHLCKKDLDKLERSTEATRSVKGLEHLLWEERLREQSLSAWREGLGWDTYLVAAF